MANTRTHYGWTILVVGWLIYGFGIAPGYYSWGQLSPHAMKDLGLNRTESGLVFGVFTLLYSLSAPLSGAFIQRVGVRAVMVAGGLVASVGFVLTSRAQTLTDALVGFSVLGGLGIGLGVLLPTQTLGIQWFIRYRATALAVLMTAGGLVGMLVPNVGEAIATNDGWRSAWMVIAACSLGVATLALLFVRNTPESVGLHPDWRRTADDTEHSKPAATDADWSAAAALRTPHFAALVLCGLAMALPWGVAVAHGPLHLRDQSFSGALTGAVMATMIFVSIAGRLTGLIGDWIRPQRALALALAIEALGMTGFLWADQRLFSFLSAACLGLGFGAAYVSLSATFGAFFGRRAFAMTAGTRMAITGVFNAAMPPLAGWAFDRSGAYTVPFLILALLTGAGACLAWLLHAPAPRGEPSGGLTETVG